jgi:hypothetical protein
MPEPVVARKGLAALAALVALLTACEPAAVAPEGYAPPPKLVAIEADFAPFRDWERIPLLAPTLPLQAMPGPAFTYVNHRPEPGSRRYPVGTILVKTVEPSDDPRDWTVHAMVKRSDRFNPEGSVGWEFFGLQLDERGVPTILWRSDGYNDGHAYGSSTMLLDPERELSCNDCHALHWQDDAVLTPALSLSSPNPDR